jgi:septum formation protein
MNKDKAKIILASQSYIRRKILNDACVQFEAINSNVDEEMAKLSLRQSGVRPKDQAHELAKLKAQKLSQKYPNDFVIGADQMLCLGNEVFDKAQSMEEARERLLYFRGKSHNLVNSVVIYKNNSLIWRYDCSPKLTMRNFSDDFLDKYLEICGDKILSSVGCYQLEGMGLQLFEKIEGDYFAILGLPMLQTLEFLRLHNMVGE